MVVYMQGCFVLVDVRFENISRYSGWSSEKALQKETIFLKMVENGVVKL